MTNYKFTFVTSNNETIEFTKEFASYMKAMHFKSEFFAKHFNIVWSSMTEDKG